VTSTNAVLRDRFSENKRVFDPTLAFENMGTESPGKIYDTRDRTKISKFKVIDRNPKYTFSKTKRSVAADKS
jgi:hypothetical protein